MVGVCLITYGCQLGETALLRAPEEVVQLLCCVHGCSACCVYFSVLLVDGELHWRVHIKGQGWKARSIEKLIDRAGAICDGLGQVC